MTPESHCTNDTNPKSPIPKAASPYATGGGGVTFERKVATRYLVHLLTGTTVAEIGDNQQILSLGFQQDPTHPVDDLVLTSALPGETIPSLITTLAVRRTPKIVLSDQSTKSLFKDFVLATINPLPNGRRQQLALVVADQQDHAKQLATLADLAQNQMDEILFFDSVHTPGKHSQNLRSRLNHIEKLVEWALDTLNTPEAKAASVRQCTWKLLSIIVVVMPRLESPNELDWSGLSNLLKPIARENNAISASLLRDHLFKLASEYSPKAATVDLNMLRRDVHAHIKPLTNNNQSGWKILHHLHHRAISPIRNNIETTDGDRHLHIDRSEASKKKFSHSCRKQM